MSTRATSGRVASGTGDNIDASACSTCAPDGQDSDFTRTGAAAKTSAADKAASIMRRVYASFQKLEPRCFGRRAGAGVGACRGTVDSGTAVAVDVPLALLPGEIGSLMTGSGADFDLGWSWQVPFTRSLRHRVAGSVDWVPGNSDHHVMGRVGYRFGMRHFFTGLGPAFDHSGTTWSPELGVKFAHAGDSDEQLDLSLHIVVRADIAPAFDRLRTVTILFGWNIL